MASLYTIQHSPPDLNQFNTEVAAASPSYKKEIGQIFGNCLMNHAAKLPPGQNLSSELLNCCEENASNIQLSNIATDAKIANCLARFFPNHCFSINSCSTEEKLTNLQHVRIWRVSDEDLSRLLKHTPNLRSMHFNGLDITEKFASQCLEKVWALSMLTKDLQNLLGHEVKHLGLKRCFFLPDSVDVLNQLPLETLNLHCSGIKNLSNLKLPFLKDLTVGYNRDKLQNPPLTPEVIAAIKENLPALTKLTVHTFGEDPVTLVENISQLNLTHFALYLGTRLVNEEVTSHPNFASFRKFLNLTSLTLGDTLIDQEASSELRRCALLTELNLYSCTLSEDAFEPLIHSRIEKLQLVSESISPANLKAIAQMSNLTTLNLYDREMTDETITHLYGLKVETLIIGNKLSGTAILSLVKTLPNLAHLHIRNCEMTDNELLQLKEVAPSLQTLSINLLSKTIEIIKALDPIIVEIPPERDYPSAL